MNFISSVQAIFQHTHKFKTQTKPTKPTDMHFIRSSYLKILKSARKLRSPKANSSNPGTMTIMKPFHPLYCSTLFAISAVFLAVGDVTADTIVQEAYLKASNADEEDWFGGSVALDGDTLVVGAIRDDSSARGVNGNQSDNSFTARNLLLAGGP